jgi:hypothetical protein
MTAGSAVSVAVMVAACSARAAASVPFNFQLTT